MDTTISKDERKQIIRFFLKIETYFLIMLAILGAAFYYAYDLIVSLIVFLSCFVFLQPFLLYPYRNLLALLVRKKN